MAADRTPEEVYVYEDERGEPLFEVCRFPGKEFRQRRPDGHWGLGDTRRVIYRLPQIVQLLADNRIDPIYIVEGEKDVHAIESLGGLATCNPMGAGKWTDDYAELLQGARRVVVVADRDEIGRAHARDIVDSLARVGVAAELAEPAEGKDSWDHIDAGYTLSDLLPIEFLTDQEGELVTRLELRVVAAEAFASVDEPSAEPLLGDDGDAVVTAGSIVLWYGDGGAGKSTLEIDAAVHLSTGTPWLGFSVPRPLRILLIENEGPRGPFRAKIGRKLDAFGPAPDLYVLEEPWAQVRLNRDEDMNALRGWVEQNTIEILMLGPVASAGFTGAGTPDDIEAHAQRLALLRHGLTRPLVIWLIHHENKAGDVSGAWERLPDTLVHVRAGDGGGYTMLTWKKTRWSSTTHGKKMTLRWTNGEGFELVDADAKAAQQAAAEESALDWIANYVTQHYERDSSGISRGKVETAYHEAHDNHGRNLARRVIDRTLLLAAQALEEHATGEMHIQFAGVAANYPRTTLLIPFKYASSPLAAPPSGETGEPPPDPRQRDTLASSPPPIEIGGERREGGEGTQPEEEFPF